MLEDEFALESRAFGILLERLLQYMTPSQLVPALAEVALRLEAAAQGDSAALRIDGPPAQPVVGQLMAWAGFTRNGEYMEWT
jgi:hypothetical protein